MSQTEVFQPSSTPTCWCGLYDGNIAVYNLQKNVGVPNYQSDAKNGKHRDIVWQVGSNGLLLLLDYAECYGQWTLDIILTF